MVTFTSGTHIRIKSTGRVGVVMAPRHAHLIAVRLDPMLWQTGYEEVAVCVNDLENYGGVRCGDMVRHVINGRVGVVCGQPKPMTRLVEFSTYTAQHHLHDLVYFREDEDFVRPALAMEHDHDRAWYTKTFVRSYWVLKFRGYKGMGEDGSDIDVYFMEPEMNFTYVMDNPPPGSPDWAPVLERISATRYDRDSAWIMKQEFKYDDNGKRPGAGLMLTRIDVYKKEKK